MLNKSKALFLNNERINGTKGEANNTKKITRESMLAIQRKSVVGYVRCICLRGGEEGSDWGSCLILRPDIYYGSVLCIG